MLLNHILTKVDKNQQVVRVMDVDGWSTKNHLEKRVNNEMSVFGELQFQGQGDGEVIR